MANEHRSLPLFGRRAPLAALVGLNLACDPALDVTDASGDFAREELDPDSLTGGEDDFVDEEAFDEELEGEPSEDEGIDGDEPFDADFDLLPGEVDPELIGADGYWSWGTPGNNGAPLDLGPSAGRTCFLIGVSGQLRAPQGADSATRAEVSVSQSGGHWWLKTQAGDGSGAMGHATCIPWASNQVEFSWGGNTGGGVYANENATSVPRGPFTHCFLTGVWGTVGWGGAATHAHLREGELNSAPVWWLGGNLIKTQTYESGGGASAVCVDLFQQVGTYGWQTSNNHPGSTGWVTPESNRVCAAHKIVGNFAHDSTGWTDGAWLFPESGWWKVFSKNGKGIFGECYNKPFQF